jgi:hypothetical protein
MVEGKVNFFHKFLIVVVMISIFSKLSKFDLSVLKNFFEASTKTEPAKTTTTRVTPPLPQREIVREYIHVPVQQLQTATSMPAVGSRASQQVFHIPENNHLLSRMEITPPSTDTVHIDDETYRRYFS